MSVKRRIEIEDYIIAKNFFKYYKVIFNNPATIVLWKDGTKTVVKCGKNDIFDPEKGLALCFMKRALEVTGGSFHKVLKKEIKREVKVNCERRNPDE